MDDETRTMIKGLLARANEKSTTDMLHSEDPDIQECGARQLVGTQLSRAIDDLGLDKETLRKARKKLWKEVARMPIDIEQVVRRAKAH